MVIPPTADWNVDVPKACLQPGAFSRSDRYLPRMIQDFLLPESAYELASTNHFFVLRIGGARLTVGRHLDLSQANNAIGHKHVYDDRPAPGAITLIPSFYRRTVAVDV